MVETTLESTLKPIEEILPTACMFSEHGCKKDKMLKPERINHEKNCEYRMVKCFQCNVDITFCKKNNHEKNQCLYRKVKCIDYECKTWIPFPNIIDHIKNADDHSSNDVEKNTHEDVLTANFS